MEHKFFMQMRLNYLLKTIEKFSDLSVQSKWIKTAPCMVILFLDQSNSDDYVKDVQSCGAIIQNIFLNYARFRRTNLILWEQLH